MVLSEVRALALDPFGAARDAVEGSTDKPPGQSWAVGPGPRPPSPLADSRAWLEYEVARARLARGGPDAAADPVLAADLLGLALHLQDDAPASPGGLPLEAVQSWTTGAGTVYRVALTNNGPHIVREHRGSGPVRVGPVTLGPQRLVRGAPAVVFLEADVTGASPIAFCTEPVRSIVAQGAGRVVP